MIELKKVNEPDRIGVWICWRCHKTFCIDCTPWHEVEFEIMDTPEGFNQTKNFQWKGERVCPWCHNQLVDLYIKEKELKLE